MQILKNKTFRLFLASTKDVIRFPTIFIAAHYTKIDKTSWTCSMPIANDACITFIICKYVYTYTISQRSLDPFHMI